MFFYEFKMTYRVPEGSLMSSVQGDGRELLADHIAKMNMLLGLHRLQEKQIFFISHYTKKYFCMLAVVNQMKPVTSEEIERVLVELLEEYGLTDVRVKRLSEVSCERINELYQQCISRQYLPKPGIKGDIMEILHIDYLKNKYFDIDEEILPSKKISKSEAMKLAEDIMADSSFCGEIERIYSEENDRGDFYGHPVHYRVAAGTLGAAMKIIRLLAQSLYSNNRLPSCRINHICNIKDTCYDEDDLKNVVRYAEGGAVIIESLKHESGGDMCYAEDYGDSIEYIAKLLGKYRRYTLSIIVESDRSSQVMSRLIENLQENMDFIKIEEGAGNRGTAAEYLKMLERSSDFPQHTDVEIMRALGEKTAFRASDVHNVYDTLIRTVLRDKKYAAYKDINTIVSHTVNGNTDKPYELLQEMIGLVEQKAMVEKIIAAFGIRKIREEKGLPVKKMSLHMCFTGNPGSAKTHMARVLAGILSEEGILPSGKIVECGRADLVGRFVGHTAVQVKKQFNLARGGILFIDEAYALVDGRKGSYGDEAIATIVQEMENHRDDVIVIFAGYPNRMEEFLSRNEGLRSRIAFHLNFPDYNENELTDILLLMARRRGFSLAPGAADKCRSIFRMVCRQEDFGNGRYVRNLLERAIMRQSERLWNKRKYEELCLEEMSVLLESDFEELNIAAASKPYIGFSAAV